MSLEGKTLFISGASRGVGLAIAMRAARDGANIALIEDGRAASQTRGDGVHGGRADPNRRAVVRCRSSATSATRHG